MANSLEVAAGVMYNVSIVVLVLDMVLFFYYIMYPGRMLHLRKCINHIIHATSGAVSADMLSAMAIVNYQDKAGAYMALVTLQPRKESASLINKAKALPGAPPMDHTNLDTQVKLSGNDPYDPYFDSSVTGTLNDYFEETPLIKKLWAW